MYSSGISRREEDAHRVAVDVAERALQEEGDPWRGTSTGTLPPFPLSPLRQADDGHRESQQKTPGTPHGIPSP